LLHEQQHQSGTGVWQFLRTHDLIARSTGISTKREKVPDTIFNLGRTEGVSQVCLTMILMMIAVLSFPAYVWSAGPPPPSGEHPLPLEHLSATETRADLVGTGNEPLCQLQPDITGFHLQDNSAWCWAASTHLVIRHLEPASNLKQCEVVYNTLKSTGTVDQYEQAHAGVLIDCCRVTDDALRTENKLDPVIIGSKTVCHTASRPDWALRANGYVTAGGQDRFKIVPWDPYKTIPEGVPWPDLTSQICMNRPFISVKLWVGGGTHSEVVTGYRLDPDGTVVLDSHSLTGVYTMSYDDYLRLPGVTVGRVRDYYDIGL
jgi:hypothetical protein